MPGYNSNVGSYRSDTIDNVIVVVLAGGVGGAKLVNGFAQVVPAGKRIVVFDTGDDFRHMGLTICPELDTVTYTLAGEANPEMGWGRKSDSWCTLREVERPGDPPWLRRYIYPPMSGPCDQ